MYVCIYEYIYTRVCVQYVCVAFPEIQRLRERYGWCIAKLQHNVTNTGKNGCEYSLCPNKPPFPQQNTHGKG